MPLDAICLSALKNELALQISGSKIDKVQQPERDVIILSLRGNEGKSQRLLISVGSDDSRVHLTEHKFENPMTPPMFCMLLRKHITGARITDITQPPGERVLTLSLEASDSMGVKSCKCLIIEMIGRQANLILTDKDGIIIDCIRRIGGDLSDKRAVLPGLIYHAPPAQEGKQNPLDITEAVFDELFQSAADETVDKWLISTFTAFSPLICREISWRSYGETDYRINAITDLGALLKNTFFELISNVNNSKFEPWLIFSDDGSPRDFSFLQILQYEGKYDTKLESSFSQMLENYYTRTSQDNRINQRSSATLKSIKTARDRLRRKLTAQKTELEETSKREYLRQCGDLIAANYHLITKGQRILKAEDFYSEAGEVREIELDPHKTPQQNAAKYYKAYTKAKNAQNFLKEHIDKGENELVYIESVLEQIGRAENEQDLNDIREELMLTGYLRASKQQKKHKPKQSDSLPIKFKSTNGFIITVGRNNIQNDKLTMKTASRHDMWFHAQRISGAHVIVSGMGETPDVKTCEEAAAIAAFYSAGCNEKKVPVDYTLVKNVKKPAGSRPGMVIYSDFRTIIAIPDEEAVKQLRVHS